MRILIVRSALEACEPDCAEWISAEGDITAATPALLRRVLKAAGGKKLPIIISSPGGDVAAGYALGRLIRKAGLDVTVGRTFLASCKPEEKQCSDAMMKGRRGWANNGGSFCNSACVFVLAGGVARHAFWISEIGVHQFASTRTLTRWRDTTRNGRVVRRQILSVRKTKVKTSQAAYDRAAAYFDEMGIDQRINGLLQLADNGSIHVMDRSELLETKIITDGQDARGLVLKLQAAVDQARLAGRDAAFTSTRADVPAGLYTGKAMISHIELRQAPGGAGVLASVTPTIGSQHVPVAGLTAAFRIGDMPALSNDPVTAGSPHSPMTVTVDAASFCALELRHTLTFVIGPRADGPVTPETVTVSTGRFRDLDILFRKVCGN